MRSAVKDVKKVLRQVTGAVSASGGIVQGLGFSVVRTSLGHYTVTFDQPFKAPPVVVISGTDQIAANYNAIVDPSPSGVTASQFIVYVSQPGSAYADMAFTFVAIEQVSA